jgi:hypothetical protein
MSSPTGQLTAWTTNVDHQILVSGTTHTFRLHDWADLRGATVEVRRNGTYFRTGRVEEATSALLWLAQEGVESRTIIDRLNGDEVWIEPQQLPFLKLRRQTKVASTPAISCSSFQSAPDLKGPS